VDDGDDGVARVGVDVGRVLISAADEDGASDTSFLSGSDAAALETPATPGGFEAVAELVRATGGRVWLVSKCGARVEALTRRWLEHHGFHERTGVPREHLRFCRARREKREHALALGLTHFVDDRLDVLGFLRGVVPHLYLFGHQKVGVVAPPWAVPVVDWREALAAVRRDLRVRGARA
jgi:hypothetical protein